MDDLLGLEEDERRNSGEPSTRAKTATATSPPLGGVSECLRGRSSDLQAAYLPGFPELQSKPVPFGLSFLLTAAGQFRILTGFPFHSPRGETVESPPYLGSVLKSRLFVVDNNPKKVHLAVQHRTLRQIEKYHADIAENRDLLFSVLSHQQNSASIVSTWLPASVTALSGPGTALAKQPHRPLSRADVLRFEPLGHLDAGAPSRSDRLSERWRVPG